MVININRKVLILAGLLLIFFITDAWAYKKTAHDIEIPKEIPDGTVILIECPIRSKPGNPGENVIYAINIKNISNKTHKINLSLEKTGFEVMPVTFKPSSFMLAPGQHKICNLEVKVVERVALGGQEKQVLKASINNKIKSEQIEFVTVRSRPHPYILVTNDLLNEVRKKVEKHNWAKANLDEMVRLAQGWEIPKAHLKKIRYDDEHSWEGLFHSESKRAWKVALAG